MLSSLFIFSQNRDTDYFVYNHTDGRKDSLEVSQKLIPMVANFIEWSAIYQYDLSKRFGDIKGVYYVSDMSETNMGEAVFRKDDKDYARISDKIIFYEVLNIVVFHELYHLFANSGVDDHCYDYTCSSIMLPAVDGYITNTLCNWKDSVEKLFIKLKTVQANGKTEDYVTECKILPEGND